jgi:hypothetical protein
MRQFFSILIIVVLFSSCQELPSLHGVNIEAWKADVGGCDEQRLKAVDTIISQSEKLKGLSENAMINSLDQAVAFTIQEIK